MRIFEIADAEAQLALWKLVNDSVWTAIQTQQHEQAKQKAAAQQQKKAKRSTKRISKRSISAPLSPPKVPMPTTKPKQPPILKSATPTQPNANPHLNPQLNPQAKAPYPPTLASTPNVKVATPTKQASDVDDNDLALANPIQSQRVLTQPPKKALTTQKAGFSAFKRA
jgi:hypothetical protein